MESYHGSPCSENRQILILLFQAKADGTGGEHGGKCDRGRAWQTERESHVLWIGGATVNQQRPNQQMRCSLPPQPDKATLPKSAPKALQLIPQNAHLLYSYSLCAGQKQSSVWRLKSCQWFVLEAMQHNLLSKIPLWSAPCIQFTQSQI